MRFAPYLAFFVSGASSLIFQIDLEPAAAPRVRLVERGDLLGGERVHGRARARRVAVRALRRSDPAAAPGLRLGRARRRAVRAVRAAGWSSPRAGSPARQRRAARALRHRSRSASWSRRFACIVPVLIVPTTLMGATLAAAVAPLRGEPARSASRSARASARCTRSTRSARCSGVFLAGFVLMPSIGVRATNLVAVGDERRARAAPSWRCGGARRARRARSPRSRDAAAPGRRTGRDRRPRPPAARTRTSRRAPVVAALAFALSGACALLYEVVWSRALVNTIGGSVYSFALILMTFLVGIAGGSALGVGAGQTRAAAPRAPLLLVARWR